MTVPARLDPVYLVVHACHDGLPQNHALAILKKKGCTPNAEALEDAVDALMHRDLFLALQGDPYLYLDGIEPDGSRPGVSVWDAAVERAEDDLTFALKLLSRRPAALTAVTG